MAQNEDGQDKSEAPTDERREQFREKGEIAFSKELVSILTLAGLVLFLTIQSASMFLQLKKICYKYFTHLNVSIETTDNFIKFISIVWTELLEMIIPFFAVVAVIGGASTFVQTRASFAWEKISPNFSRLNPLNGMSQLFSMQPIMEITKGIGKTIIVGTISFLMLYGEIKNISFLYHLPIQNSWLYWGIITKNLIFTTCGFLLFIAGADYVYNYFMLEQKMKMSKQELKEEYRQRELDPNVKGRMRKMQRDIATRKTVDATRKATVLITNPTHFSIAVRYEVGMRAPIILAKGADFVALRMREIAKDLNIPIVENKPLAQTLYKTVKINQEIPEALYKALSEVISYVFKIRGIRLNS